MLKANDYSYLRDPLETEDDAQDVLDMMEAFRRIDKCGQRYTSADWQRFQDIVAELHAERRKT